MSSHKSFCSWEGNGAKDGDFLCDTGWRRINQSTPSFSRKMMTTKKPSRQSCTESSVNVTLQRHRSLRCFYWRTVGLYEAFKKDVAILHFIWTPAGWFFFHSFVFFCVHVSCCLDWLSKSSWCPFLAQGTALDAKPREKSRMEMVKITLFKVLKRHG